MQKKELRCHEPPFLKLQGKSALIRFQGRPPTSCVPWAMILASGLVAGLHGVAWAEDLEGCRALRQERDALASRAMEHEIELVRRFRARICPKLALLAERANARDGQYGTINFADWNRCRLQAERELERSSNTLYRNRQGFTFYTAAGASLAEQADQRSRDLQAQGCG